MALTFIQDIDMVNVQRRTKFGDPTSNGSLVMIFFLVNYYLVTFGIVTDRRKLVHKSPPCISKGGLNKN